MSVAVIVPWRGGNPHREAAWRWVSRRFAERHPDWEMIQGVHDDDGPWRKGAAVAKGVAQTSADVLIIHDGDVWCDGLAEAVAQIEAGHEWSIPHDRVHRLVEEATVRVLAGEEPDTSMTCERASYHGVRGGGVVVVPRALLAAIPMDPRFLGWGNEDLAFGDALRAHSRPWRGDAPLFHLFHPISTRLSPYMGSLESGELCLRYRRARRRPPQMEVLLAETHEALRELGLWPHEGESTTVESR